jgi:hypothetical protein
MFKKYRRIQMVKEFVLKSSNEQFFVFALYFAPSAQYSIITCKFSEGDAGVQKFNLLDTYHLKEQRVFNTFSLSPINRVNRDENPILALIAYNGSSLMEVTIGGNVKVASRLSAKVKHSFNFKMKAT